MARQSGAGVDASDERPAQLAYSDLQPVMRDEDGRRGKAAKIIAVLEHFLGRADLTGLTALDVGCSTGFIADELHRAGAVVTGMDIDEPGVEGARARFGENVTFVLTSGESIPAPSDSFDIVVYNHIYEHVVDPDAVLAEIRRVLRPDGVVYLGLGNRLGVIEPHYRLPFLSWLPKSIANRYVRASKRASTYHETFRTRRGLQRMCAGLFVWDYTYTILAEPDAFAAGDMVPGRLAAASPRLWRALGPIIPTFIWIGTPTFQRPAGGLTRVAPSQVTTG